MLWCCLALLPPPLLVDLRVCPLWVWCLPLVLPLRPVRLVDMSVLGCLPAQRGAAGACLVERGPARLGRSPSAARCARSARASATSSSAFSDADERACAMPSIPTGRPGVGGSRSKSDCSASDRDHSPQPGPLGLGSGARSSSGADRSRSVYGGRSSPLLLARQMMTAVVPSTQSIWIRMNHSGLCFASSGISIVWRNRQVKCISEQLQDFSCTGLRATTRVFPGSSLASFPPYYSVS